MAFISNIARSPGDPKVLRTGRSSLGLPDRLARTLGWFSIALGLTEVLAARTLANALGMNGKEQLIRAYGVRELGAGVLSLSVDKQAGLVSRVAGDGLDLATLATALRNDNPKRQNVGVAIAMVIGVTLLDVLGAQGVAMRHNRRRGQIRDYGSRTGFPGGVAAARGRARKDFTVPPDMRATPQLARVSSSSTAAAAE
jgi:hypothetical protein